jgi:hypothetical protein
MRREGVGKVTFSRFKFISHKNTGRHAFSGYFNKDLFCLPDQKITLGNHVRHSTWRRAVIFSRAFTVMEAIRKNLGERYWRLCNFVVDLASYYTISISVSGLVTKRGFELGCTDSESVEKRKLHHQS